MPTKDSYSADVVTRTHELLHPRTKWSRALWDLGLVLSLTELDEAAAGVQIAALSNSALKSQAVVVRSKLHSDPGSGSAQERAALDDLLTQTISAGGANHGQLKLWTELIRKNYLARWHAAMESDQKPSRERAARAFASHMLDAGFHGNAVKNWLSAEVMGQEDFTASMMFERAQSLFEAAEKSFEFGALFAIAPGLAPDAENFRSAQKMHSWLAANGSPASNQFGGLVFSVLARDEYSALSKANDVLERISARSHIGSKRRLEFADRLFMGGYPTAVKVDRSRGAEMRSLERQSKVLLFDENREIDSALELASHLNTSAGAVAIAGGWSAIEFLLAAPGDEDKAITARRLANLVACAWPRAELTTIAARRTRQSRPRDEMGQELFELQTNRERAERIRQSIESEVQLELRWSTDRLAARRVAKLLRSPHTQLNRIRSIAAGVFRQTYTQRNLALHGGQTDSHVMDAVLRVASPLIGAGIDRLVHARLVSGTMPVELAARAKFEIDRAGTADAPPLTAVLE